MVLGINRPYRYGPPLTVIEPDPLCGCGCGEQIAVIELRTHEGEPIASESCFMRIAYSEGWLKRVG